jgi:hypothetical protein
MVLDIRTRISLAAVEADEVAVLLELSRHLSSVLLVPGDKNLLVQTVNWVIRRNGVGTGHTKQLLSSSLEVELVLHYNNSMVGEGALHHPFAGMDKKSEQGLFMSLYGRAVLGRSARDN